MSKRKVMTLEACNAEISALLATLAKTPEIIWADKQCVCLAGTSCDHPQARWPNTDHDRLRSRIEELRSFEFCCDCGLRREGDNWWGCPFCVSGPEKTWARPIHNTPECVGLPSGLKYCSGCGQKN
jgi:hypothetical protein